MDEFMTTPSSLSRVLETITELLTSLGTQSDRRRPTPKPLDPSDGNIVISME